MSTLPTPGSIPLPRLVPRPPTVPVLLISRLVRIASVRVAGGAASRTGGHLHEPEHGRRHPLGARCC
ncbi:CbtB-domain containing protein [Actinomadura sp. 7K507]|uniref:CbtB-domain containing protein n=1 Tax=Actinomadura sp. 7K507 TaxID=2530365 RepID=UPI001047BA30|nr:CbtB-domain containing protein [Actinomadura sp. 7K507]TDC97639.1 CbtB-domain containing protein [Actinomadura sp. 7K507]